MGTKMIGFPKFFQPLCSIALFAYSRSRDNFQAVNEVCLGEHGVCVCIRIEKWGQQL